MSLTAEIGSTRAAQVVGRRRSVERALAVAALVVTSALHMPVAIAHLQEVRYLGLLLAGYAVATAAVAASLAVAETALTWLLALLLSVGALVTYAVSRTFGLPLAGDDHGDWTNHTGVIAAIAELVLVVLAIRNLSAPKHQLKGNQK